MSVNAEKVGMDLDKEKLLFLLVFIEDYLDELIEKVLSDSKLDPHYSAVTVSNIIKCYIDTNKYLGKSLPYTDVKSYFKFNAYTEEEYTLFENIRKNEAEYFIGKQY